MKELEQKAPEVEGEHIQSATHKSYRYHPNHDPRKAVGESDVFRHTKKYWHELGVKCFIGARCEGGIEIHHKYVEWSDSNGVNWDKMRILYKEFDWTTFTEPKHFVDSIFNTVPLCEKHHRHENHGIHCIPGPDWEMQRHETDDFVYSPDEEPLEKHGEINASKPKI